MSLDILPETVVEAGPLWTIAINRNQNLLGKVMLVLNRPCTDVVAVRADEWSDLQLQIGRVTAALAGLFSPDRFNFSFLMNEDAQVHLHVLPRYRRPRRWFGLVFEDPDFGGVSHSEPRWPAPHVLGQLASQLLGALRQAGGDQTSPPERRDWTWGWQRRWDLLEAELVPHREWLLANVVDLVQAVAGHRPTVVDLACGTGSVTLRLLERLPEASVIALDVDPVLLSIARETFRTDPRVRVVTWDLRGAGLVSELQGQSVDAVVTSTALHWLSEPAVRRLYRDLARLIRPGGLFAHAERMPIAEAPALKSAMAGLVRQRAADRTNPSASWDSWWKSIGADPLLSGAVDERKAIFATSYPMAEFSPPADWHKAALIEAGFSESAVMFRSANSAIIGAIR